MDNYTKDLKYALRELVKAIEENTNAINTRPMTEESYNRIIKTEAKLNSILSLSKELLNVE